MSEIKDGGPAFPRVWVDDGRPAEVAFGMTLRDYFAIHAPEPDADSVQTQRTLDKHRNPYNESHKPRLRNDLEIRSQLRYDYADAMIAARERK